MDSSDDEEERLRRWKEHLAAQQTEDEDDGPPHSALVPARRGDSSSGARAHSARRIAEDAAAARPAGMPRDSLDAAARGGESDSIDWMSAMMPQMRQLQQERDGLEAKIKEQERMISRLNHELKSSIADGTPTDQKEAKIVELAKKNRALTLALDKEKAKSGRATADLKRLQEELEAANRSKEAFVGMDARSLPKEVKANKDAKPAGALAFGQKVPTDASPENEATPEDKVKELTSKVAALNGQVNSQRLANERLKQENSKVKEALKRELGDVPLDTALRALEGGGGAGWTGRAQTISLLQSKISELKRELAVSLDARLSHSDSSCANGVQGGAECGGGRGGAVVPGSPSKLDKIDAQHRREIDKIERERRQEAHALQEVLDKERGDKAALKRKLDAAASRVSVLEKETRDLRDKMEVLLSKTDNDDELIEALQAEMASMAKSLKAPRASRKDEAKREDPDDHTLLQLEEKASQIQRQHKIILSLRAELQAAVMRGKEASTRAERAAGMERAEDQVLLTRLSAANHEVRMLQVEKAKLSELTDVLKRKLAEAEEEANAASALVRQERQKSVELQRLLPSESAQAHRTARSGSGASWRSTGCANSFPPEKVQQLVDRLNCTTEEMEALQLSFQRTLSLKELEVRGAKEQLREQELLFREAQAELEQKLGHLQSLIQLNHARSHIFVI